MVGRRSRRARENGRRGSARRAEGGREPRYAGLRQTAEHQDDVRRRLQRHAVAHPPPAPRDGSLSAMATMNMIQALNSAMDVMLTKDPDVLVFGEDVGFFGGVFR